MLPVCPGNIPDFAQRGPECYQKEILRSGKLPARSGMLPLRSGKLPEILVFFRTSTDEVRNITKIPWCFSGPRSLRSGILPVVSGNIPDLTHRGPECYQEENLRSGMLPTRSGMLPARSGMLPKILVIFRTSLCEVLNVT